MHPTFQTPALLWQISSSVSASLNATSELSTYGLKEPFGRAARPHGHSTFATARARRDSDGSSKRSTPSTAVRPATNAASVRGSTANPLVNSAASRIESHVPISAIKSELAPGPANRVESAVRAACSRPMSRVSQSRVQRRRQPSGQRCALHAKNWPTVRYSEPLRGPVNRSPHGVECRRTQHRWVALHLRAT